MKKEILDAIEAIIEGETPHFVRNEDKDTYLYVRNPYYDPEISGSFPSLVIEFEKLKALLERKRNGTPTQDNA